MTGLSARGWAWIGSGVCLVTAVVLTVVAGLGTASTVAGIAALVLAVAQALYAWRAPASAPASGSSTPGAVTVEASGERSVASGGAVGTVVTGDRNTTRAGASTTPPSGAGGATGAGSARASGPRSVASSGDIGTAVTGDDNTTGP